MGGIIKNVDKLTKKSNINLTNKSKITIIIGNEFSKDIILS